uniref:DASH complex subunit DAM1 n=1 Tax=Ganoderma boninense TaxID=34458 RepID=A0A5K1K3Y0_9APHY|nr:Protein kinase domain-containing protein [Ganoderma boninense]
MMPPNPPQTPLRRLSQGSLFRLSRSGAYPDAPHGLGFLEPALAELIDEAEALQTNAEGLKNLDIALETFNESFASWLYVMNMNALTVDFPQAPADTSFALAARRAEEDAQAALDAIRAAEAAARRPPTPPEPTMTTERSALSPSEGRTEATISTATTSANKTTAKPGVLKKKAAKPKLTAKEKRERGLEIERILAALPLEFRGDDPNLRRHIELVIEKFFDNPGESFNIVAFVKPPDLNQARVNKCLIALVNRKIVKKDNSTGAVLYHWNGLPQ